MSRAWIPGGQPPLLMLAKSIRQAPKPCRADKKLTGLGSAQGSRHPAQPLVTGTIQMHLRTPNEPFFSQDRFNASVTERYWEG